MDVGCLRKSDFENTLGNTDSVTRKEGCGISYGKEIS